RTGWPGSLPMQRTPLASLPDNYSWSLPGDDGRFLVVDPGEAAPVLAAAAGGREPAAVLLTHHHGDHVDGVPALLERWPELPVYARSEEHTSELQSRENLVCRLLLEKKKRTKKTA